MCSRLQGSGIILRLGAIVLAAMLDLLAGPRRRRSRSPRPIAWKSTPRRCRRHLQGARVATTKEAEKLWRERGAIFVDVLPRPPKPKDLPAGTLWHEPPHSDIPGSVWLADVGYGGLTPEMEAWYRDTLAEATGGDAVAPAPDLLPRRLLDVLERREARRRLGLFQCHLVSGRRRRLAGGGLPLEERQPLRPAGAE